MPLRLMNVALLSNLRNILFCFGQLLKFRLYIDKFSVWFVDHKVFTCDLLASANLDCKVKNVNTELGWDLKKVDQVAPTPPDFFLSHQHLARPKALKLQGFRIKLFLFCSQLILLNFRMTLRASFVPFNPTPSSSNFAKPGSTSSTPTKQKFRFGLKTFKLQTVSLIDG